MKESEFIDQNTDKWLEYESIIKQNQTDPDKLSEVFIQVTDDLSHSRSHYTNRSVRVYLNDLAVKIFDKLGRRKKFGFGVIREFYGVEVPQLMYLARREMLISFAVLLLSMGIGIYSSIQNPEFASVVLGEQYVQMTLDNISKGEAMDVYTGGSGMQGFVQILLNNAHIDVMMLGLGIFFGFGALLVLIRNGIMIGVFQYFFYQHGGFHDSLLTIWLHGTIEVTTIGLMGGVALLAGKGLLFPGNYTRYQSFRLSAGNATKLLLMVLPFTVVAALIEGFITRMTDMPDVAKGAFILLSLAIVVFYFFIYPIMINRKFGANPIHEKLRREHPTLPIDLNEIKTPAKVIAEAFVTYKENFARNIGICLLAGLGYVLIVFYFFPQYFIIHTAPAVLRVQQTLGQLLADQTGLQAIPQTERFRILSLVYFGFWSIVLLFVNARKAWNYKLKWSWAHKYLGVIVIVAVAGYLYSNVVLRFPFNLIKSYGFVWILMFAVGFLKVMHYYKIGWRSIMGTLLNRGFSVVVLWLALSAVTFFVHLLIHSMIANLTIQLVNDLLPFSPEIRETVGMGLHIGIYYTVVLALMPLYYYSLYYFNLSLVEKYNAVHMQSELDDLSFEKN